MTFGKPGRLAAAVFLCAVASLGGNTSSANEIYAMTKFTFCGVPDSGGSASVTISSTAFSSSGERVATATENRVVRICDTATNKEIKSLSVPTALGPKDELIVFVAFTTDGTRLATASDDRMVRLWDIASGRELATLVHPTAISFATFSPGWRASRHINPRPDRAHLGYRQRP